MNKPEAITRAEQWSEYTCDLMEQILVELKKLTKTEEPVTVSVEAVVAEPIQTKKKGKKKTE